jgi:hypothetical protein
VVTIRASQAYQPSARTRHRDRAADGRFGAVADAKTPVDDGGQPRASGDLAPARLYPRLNALGTRSTRSSARAWLPARGEQSGVAGLWCGGLLACGASDRDRGTVGHYFVPGTAEFGCVVA